MARLSVPPTIAYAIWNPTTWSAAAVFAGAIAGFVVYLIGAPLRRGEINFLTGSAFAIGSSVFNPGFPVALIAMKLFGEQVSTDWYMVGGGFLGWGAALFNGAAKATSLKLQNAAESAKASTPNQQ